MASLGYLLNDSTSTGKSLVVIPSTSFTPTMTYPGGAGTIPVYSTNTAYYSRIGDQVFVDVYLTGDGGDEGSGGSGNLAIALPVTANANHPTSFFTCGYALNNVTEYDMFGQIAGSATTIVLYYLSAISTISRFAANDQNSTTRTIRLKFNYFA